LQALTKSAKIIQQMPVIEENKLGVTFYGSLCINKNTSNQN